MILPQDTDCIEYLSNVRTAIESLRTSVLLVLLLCIFVRARSLLAGCWLVCCIGGFTTHECTLDRELNDRASRVYPFFFMYSVSVTRLRRKAMPQRCIMKMIVSETTNDCLNMAKNQFQREILFTFYEFFNNVNFFLLINYIITVHFCKEVDVTLVFTGNFE